MASEIWAYSVQILFCLESAGYTAQKNFPLGESSSQYCFVNKVF